MSNMKYKNTMVKIKNLKKKFILIQQYTGLGNKIFDCIIGIYLKYNYDYNIYYVNTITKHTKENDPDITEIFQGLKNEFILISDNEGDYIKFLLNNNKKKFNNNISLSNLHQELNKDQLFIYPPTLYYMVNKMYNSFNDTMKSIFIINKNLIDPEIIKLSDKTYAVIHIRYGDKLSYSLKLDEPNNFNKNPVYIIYTPKFYYNQIKEIKKLNIPIIILSDSNEIVKHFILEKYNLINDPIISLINTSTINSFWLLYNSSYLTLNESTFSCSARLLSDNIINKKIYRPPIFNELSIRKKKKYVLNFNQKKIKKMLKYIKPKDN